MNWMNSRKGFWTCFAGIAFVTMILFFMSAYGMPTATDSPTPSDPVPTLVSPEIGETINGKRLFSWQLDGTLQEGEWFDLRMWRFDKSPKSVSMRRCYEYLLDSPTDGFGHYLWQVAVVRIDESGSKSTLSESRIGSFVWSDEPPDAVVTVHDVLPDLRSGPGTNYDIVGWLRQGDYVEVTGKNTAGTWLEVACPNRGKKGWVLAPLLEINLDMSDVPTAQIPPTPTPVHTPAPIVTPTPTLLPPPIPLEPLEEDGASFIGEPVILRWWWNRPRAPNEVFSVRVRKEGDTKLCHHAQAKDLEWRGSLSYCEAGTHYWSVALVRDLAPWLPEDAENRWQDLSEPSEEQGFYYTPGEEPWTWPVPPSDDDDDNGGTGGLPGPP